MPRWKEGEKEFVVSVNFSKGNKVNIPQPIIEMLGNPEKIKFVIRGKRVIITHK